MSWKMFQVSVVCAVYVSQRDRAELCICEKLLIDIYDI